MPNDLGTQARQQDKRWTRAADRGKGGLHGNPALEAVVRRSVVPGLARLHRPAASLPDIGSVQRAWLAEAAALSRALPGLDLAEAARALRALNPGGTRFEAVCHDVLLPAAAWLRRQRAGEPADEAGYLMGVWRLRMLLIGLDDDGLATAARPRGGASALLVAGSALAPSLEHAVVLRLFERAGWSVRSCGRLAEEDPSTIAGHDRFDLAWFSIDDATDLGRLAVLVAEMRRASCNHGIRVVSGWLLPAPPPAAASLGADAVTPDATRAVALAGQVLGPD
ncbi:hypothetical protein ACFQS7_10115 [Dankookia sp. GCM10030260]|uniref:hypothetical protein n=1 Tax=Dankookia sp. GCM10030260 TaxID=3273390 RepID=UPI0036230971